MELTETKVKSLTNGQNLSKLNEGTFDEIMRLAKSDICGKTDSEGTYRHKCLLV